MKIVLIGFMGTGKTSVAPLLAEKLDLAPVEMDDLIVQKAGGKTIETIFAEDGENAFRKLETEVAKDLENRDDVVISTGGGVVMHELTMHSLAKQALVVELSGSFETLLRRIGSAIPRPLFKDTAQAKALYERRQPLYSKYATLRIATDNKSVDDVAEEIVRQVQNL